MDRANLLQDWLTVEGGAFATVVQDESGWVDISAYRDVVIHVSVSNVAVRNELHFDTAPDKDESLFESLGVVTSVATVTRLRSLYATSNPPPARWVRWRAVNVDSGQLAITFRAWMTSVATG